MKVVLNLIYFPLILIIHALGALISGNIQYYEFVFYYELVFSLKMGLMLFGLLTIFDMFYYSKEEVPLGVFFAKRGILILIISTVIISFMAWIIPRAKEESLFAWVVLFVLGELIRNYLAYLITKRKKHNTF